jgi:hypothetical protein
MAAGLAKGSARYGRLAAFGDGQKIIWHRNAYEIFKGNPNVAPPGYERTGKPIDWIIHYPGKRVYCRLQNGKWIWNHTFKPIPGEIYLDDKEREWAASFGDSDVIIEPNVKHRAPNKQWVVQRYQVVANRLSRLGMDVAQFDTGPVKLTGVRLIQTPTFRHACASLERAMLYVGPEGGLHHAAAALGVKAVVIFGGFISPKVTGYDSHTNLFSGQGLGCGTIAPCNHCKACMIRISVDMVCDAIDKELKA